MRALFHGLAALALAFALAFAPGCGDKDSAEQRTCTEDPGVCDDGQVCYDDQCRVPECTTSGECDFNHYCDASYTCIKGCTEDTDCKAGFTCDTELNECQEYGCRDTELDCEYGEFCQEETGDCFEDPREHCASCDVFNPNSCGNGASCYYFGGESCNNNNDCDDGYTCENLGAGKVCHRDFCFVECNANADEPCPRGYSCVDASGVGDYVCFADCDYMVDNGYVR